MWPNGASIIAPTGCPSGQKRVICVCQNIHNVDHMYLLRNIDYT
jgi:hypothetical protein